MDPTSLAPLLAVGIGSGGLGGIIVQYFSRAAERRDARARVLRALARTEQARWDPTPFDEFITAGHELFAASLVAQLPRPVVGAYLTAALVAHMAAVEDPIKEYEDEPGGISQDLQAVVHTTAALVAGAVWHPWRSRLGRTRRVRALTVSIRSLNVEAGRTVTPYDRIADMNSWAPFALPIP